MLDGLVGIREASRICNVGPSAPPLRGAFNICDTGAQPENMTDSTSRNVVRLAVYKWWRRPPVGRTGARGDRQLQSCHSAAPRRNCPSRCSLGRCPTDGPHEYELHVRVPRRCAHTIVRELLDPPMCPINHPALRGICLRSAPMCINEHHSPVLVYPVLGRRPGNHERAAIERTRQFLRQRHWRVTIASMRPTRVIIGSRSGPCRPCFQRAEANRCAALMAKFCHGRAGQSAPERNVDLICDYFSRARWWCIEEVSVQREHCPSQHPHPALRLPPTRT